MLKTLNPQRPHFLPVFKLHTFKFQIIIQLFSKTNREACNYKSEESYPTVFGVYNYFVYKPLLYLCYKYKN